MAPRCASTGRARPAAISATSATWCRRTCCAAVVENEEALGQAYNVADGQRTSLNELFDLLRERLLPRHPHLSALEPAHGPFRSGDVLHSLADISKARRLLGYDPSHTIEQGLDEALPWYEEHLG